MADTPVQYAWQLHQFNMDSGYTSSLWIVDTPVLYDMHGEYTSSMICMVDTLVQYAWWIHQFYDMHGGYTGTICMVDTPVQYAW